jgi:uroporphyrinogen-III synthase
MAGLGQALPQPCQFAAVGEGTAQAMREYDIPVDCQPEISNGSEGLLQMPLMQADKVRGKHILIVRGNGGREHMADTLKARGANISYVEVYQRVLAKPTVTMQKQAVLADKVICTSVAGVDNLCSIFMNTWPGLLDKPLTVVSDRIKQHASARGFKTIHVSADASDNAVVDTLINMDD